MVKHYYTEEEKKAIREKIEENKSKKKFKLHPDIIKNYEHNLKQGYYEYIDCVGLPF